MTSKKHGGRAVKFRMDTPILSWEITSTVEINEIKLKVYINI